MLALAGASILVRRRVPAAGPAAPGLAAPVIAVLLLLATGWGMAFLAGPVGLALAALPDGPFSPAAQAFLVPPIAAAAWLLAGLWPAHRAAAHSLLALAGLALLGRIVVPGFPEGLEHWRSLLALLLVVALWRAAFTRREAEAFATLALFGAIVAGPGGVGPGAWLLAAAATIAALAELHQQKLLPLAPGAAPLRWLAALVALAGLPSLVLGGLRTEFVYTLLAVLALFAGIGTILRHRLRS
ncbi:MAG TPA: hypothetical protein VFS40_03575 [Gemmatimonadales bacterium]|nr:hypothetical protein [Gemmatimonadales bacterium]